MKCLVATWADSGHVRPLLPAVEALVSRGNDILVVSDPRIERDPEIGNLGVRTFPDPQELLPETDLAAFKYTQSTRPVEQRAIAGVDHFLRQAEVVTPFVVEAIEEFRPDVIFRESGFFAGWFAGLLTDVPVATFGVFPRPPSQARPVIADRLRAAMDRVGAHGTLDSLDRWLTIYGLPRCWFGPDPLPATSHLVQPAEPRVVDDGTAARLLADLPERPTVYVTLGTSFSDTPGLFQLVVDGAASLDVNVIATIGRSDAMRVDLARHANVRIASFVPQSLLLPRCDAVVAHGGYGSLMGALRAGLPVVSVPVGAADNVPNAQRLEIIGAGHAVLHEDRSSRDVADALRDVLDDASYRAAARRVADEIKTLPIPAHSATLIEQLAETRLPVLSMS